MNKNMRNLAIIGLGLPACGMLISKKNKTVEISII